MIDASAIVAGWSHDWRTAMPTRTPDEEAALIAEARRAVASLQEAARDAGQPGRALHRKTLVESSNARFDIWSDVPAALHVGPFTPRTAWPATVRLSSAFPRARSDEAPDQRGLGVHIEHGGRRLDLLATTGEAHHARDARAMIASLGAAASAARGGIGGRLGALFSLVGAIGPNDAIRLLRTVSRAARADVSLAALAFYSRAPFQLGPFAVRYRFAPLGGANPPTRGTGPNALSEDLEERLDEAPVSWAFELQGYRDPRSTPMDDHRVAWRSEWIRVATLTLSGVTAVSQPLTLRATPSWPGAAGAVLEPLGDLNMLRAAAYDTSQTGRREGTVAR